MEPAVRDNPAAHRFEIDVDGRADDEHRAVANYDRDGDVVVFTHTFVPTALRGRGLATRLVVESLKAMRERRLAVVPRCAMFAAYMKAHAETHDLLTDDARRELGV